MARKKYIQPKVDSSKKKSRFSKTDIILFVVIGLSMFALLFISNYDRIKNNNNIKNYTIDYNQEVINSECNSIYLGICFDESSKFYRYNLIDERINIEDFELVSRIRYIEYNNIRIYGFTNCQYCQKELSDFGKYGQSVMDRGIFIFCDVTPKEECNNIESVPTWKQNGEIIHVGYVSLENIV